VGRAAAVLDERGRIAAGAALLIPLVAWYELYDRVPDQPDWLSHVNAGVLKVKLAMALIGISSIHLLKTFINAPHMTETTIKWQVMIHLTFVLSALAMAYTDRIATTPRVAQ